MPVSRALQITIAMTLVFVAPCVRAQKSEPSREQAQMPQRLQYPPLFFREDWTLAGGFPNTNTPQEPEHTVVQADLKNPNLEVHLWGDKVGPVTVKQTYNDDITTDQPGAISELDNRVKQMKAGYFGPPSDGRQSGQIDIVVFVSERDRAV